MLSCMRVGVRCFRRISAEEVLLTLVRLWRTGCSELSEGTKHFLLFCTATGSMWCPKSYFIGLVLVWIPQHSDPIAGSNDGWGRLFVSPLVILSQSKSPSTSSFVLLRPQQALPRQQPNLRTRVWEPPIPSLGQRPSRATASLLRSSHALRVLHAQLPSATSQLESESRERGLPLKLCWTTCRSWSSPFHQGPGSPAQELLPSWSESSATNANLSHKARTRARTSQMPTWS